MKFRPCIDIHNGQVKQIVGGSLLDQGDQAVENFAATQEADYFADMYKKDGLTGGHVILLNPASSEYYAKTKEQALKALLQLTEGNRLVGIISHVSELKDQIDKKIIVTKQRTPEGVSSVARVE